MTPEEQAAADAAAAKAKADAEAKAKDPAYLEAELKKVIEQREKLKEKLKPLEDSAAELQAIKDKDLSESQRLAKEVEALKPKASRADALETQVQAILDAETASLTPEQKAAIMGDTPEAKLGHLRALQAAGMLAKPTVPPIGANLPGAGGAGTITQSAFVNATEAQRKHYRQQVAEGKLKVVPG